MDRIPVASSCIASVGYDPATLTLEVEFRSGRVYLYSGVPAGVYEDLLAAPSRGRYLNASIKGRYPYVKVG